MGAEQTVPETGNICPGKGNLCASNVAEQQFMSATQYKQWRKRLRDTQLHPEGHRFIKSYPDGLG